MDKSNTACPCILTRQITKMFLFFFTIWTIIHQPLISAKEVTRFSVRDIINGAELDFSNVLTNIKDVIVENAACASCELGITLLRHIIDGGRNIESASKLALKICLNLNIQSLSVCQGIIDRQGKDLFEAISVSSLSNSEICTFLWQYTCHDERYDWSIDIPLNRKIDKPIFIPPSESVPKLKILHISDTHWDPHYQEGANAECEDVLCCRSVNGKPKTQSASAGRWGNYKKCDMPIVLFENALKHIADTHKDIDYVIWTGDLIPHDIWNQTEEGNLKMFRESVEMMAKHLKGIPIYPTVGNHESCPVDRFIPPGASAKKNMSWLYDELNKEWSRWLPSDTSETIKRGAFYSAIVRPGLRIISVNGNYCSRYNFWLLKNNTDPADQLSWLVRELELSERNNEKVHIIGHTPPGCADCIKIWSRNFYRIISRYERTITAQFYGHTHMDEYEIFYDANDIKRPINVAYISPSLTPWEKVNPAYRIYYVDGDHSNTSRTVLDHETWIMDLGEANRIGKPVWHKAYTARKSYGMRSLHPQEWDYLVSRMNNDQNLFDLFYRNYHRNSLVWPDCNSDCKKSLLCDLKSGRSHDRKNFCKQL